jgi:hypothetical protein
MAEQPSIHANVHRSHQHRPPILRVAVAGSATAGGFALILVTGPLRPEIFIAAGIAIFVAVAVYIAAPRVGTIAFLVLGTLVCAACALALVTLGAVPWLLTSFWAGAATLLAGLLDLIGREGAEYMIGVTVAAVVSLLLLSALGLGQYVRLNWPLTGRVLLESLPTGATSRTGPDAQAMGIEPAPHGQWVGRWVVRTRDAVLTWDSMVVAIEADGWRVTDNLRCSRLRATKDGFALVVMTEDATGTAPAQGGTLAGSSDGTLELAAYVGSAP